MGWITEAKLTTVADKVLKVQKTNEDAAKATRDAYIESDILYDGSLFQVDSKGRDNMRNALEISARDGRDPSTSRGWILADNSIRIVTAADLGNVLDLYTERMDAAFTAYAIWRASDKMTPFVIGV